MRGAYADYDAALRALSAQTEWFERINMSVKQILSLYARSPCERNRLQEDFRERCRREAAVVQDNRTAR
jgi:hypothetical protein